MVGFPHLCEFTRGEPILMMSRLGFSPTNCYSLVFFVAVLMMVDNCFFWGSPIINPKPLYFGWTRGKQDAPAFFLAKDCHFWAENTWDFVSLLKTFLWKLRITHQSAESSTWYIVCWEQQEKLEGQLPLQSFVLGTDRDRYWGRDSWSKPRISQNPRHWRFCVWSLDLGWDVLGQSAPFDPQILGHIMSYLSTGCLCQKVGPLVSFHGR